MKLFKRILPIIFLANTFAEIDYTILQSNEHELIIEVKLNVISEEDLKPISILIGLPDKEFPELFIEYGKIYNVSDSWYVSEYDGIKWINIQRLQNLNVATLQIDPKKDSNQYYKQIRITCVFKKNISNNKSPNHNQNILLEHRVINWPIAKQWIKPFSQKKIKREMLLSVKLKI